MVVEGIVAVVDSIYILAVLVIFKEPKTRTNANSLYMVNLMPIYSQNNFSFKSSVKGLIVSESIVVLLFVLSSIALFRVPVYSNWIPVVVIFIFGNIVFFWFKSFNIQCANGILKYRSPFGGIKEIPIQEIEEAYIEAGVLDKKDVYRGFFRLVLRPKATSKMKGFYINMAVFDNANIKKLIDILPMRK